jgi:UDP-glucose 4-epimerase
MLQHMNEKPVPPRRAVVIGAGGFVGGAIASALQRDGVQTLNLTRKEVDLLSGDAPSTLSGLLQADDALVFVSAVAPVRNSAQLIQNLRMAEVVGQAIIARLVAHVVYISSDAVYADDANPIIEESRCQPSSLHGMMHAARELMLRTEIKTPLAILRPSLLYGAQDPHNGYGPNRFRRSAAKGERITLFGNGEEMRDHIYIEDVGKLVALVLAHRSAGILNLATGVSTSFHRIAEMIAACASKPVEIVGTPRQNPITHRHFDIAACLKAFPQFRYTRLAAGLELSESTAI